PLGDPCYAPGWGTGQPAMNGRALMTRRVVCLAVILMAGAVAGCGKTPPPFTEVSGVVLLDGQPLPRARVEFQPELSNFGAEMISSAVTDDDGRFTLTRSGRDQPGAAVGKHRVLIKELPTPREFRSQDPGTQARYAEYKSKLKNRPIPAGYGELTTAIEVEVKPEQKEYKIELKRNP
ncbi:MAG TPA: carboxypeptidase-like regulatory domain-containing protein, partial [Gemmataceae bacterium]|nr:carboxypeptidase-like regulatory domain-containing protein [Gemmataceae bacterium]